MDNITALLHKFSKKSVDVVTIASGNSSNVPSAHAMFENRMTIAELLDSEWTPDIEFSTIITLRRKPPCIVSTCSSYLYVYQCIYVLMNLSLLIIW